MPYLEVKLGPDTMLLPFVGRIDYVFGRLPKADIQLRDMKVSRLHTQVFIDSQGQAFVRDLGSSGGTYIGNQRMRKGMVAPLVDNAKLRIGDAKITYFDAEPPANAIDPPANSEPRGAIRTNQRERGYESDATALGIDVDEPETHEGPSEEPPEVNPADFSDGAGDAPKSGSGIVEAPWEKRQSGHVQPGKKDQKISLQRGRSQASDVPPKMESFDYDETGQVRGEDVPPPSPPVVHDNIVSPEELDGDDMPVHDHPVSGAPAPDIRAANEPEHGPIDETGETSRSEPVEVRAFQTPPPISGAMPVHEDDAPPKLGMPTVRLERPDVEARQISDEPEQERAPRIPTAKLDRAELDARRENEEESPASQIGGGPPESERAEPPTTVENLSDTRITELLGDAAGELDEIDFGDGDAPDDEADDGEVEFGAAAAKLDQSTDIDIDEDADEPDIDDDIPSYDEEQTPPPITRKGATPDRTFKPRKTRKLMKRKRETDDVTDEKAAQASDPGLVQGADTMFVPKPDDATLSRMSENLDTDKLPQNTGMGERPTGRPRRLNENLKSRSVEDVGAGPGGDTVALPTPMLDELRDELKSQGKRDEPATIGENPTVKRSDDDEEESIVDDDYAFFTPPPVKNSAPQPEDDVIDASDHNNDADKNSTG